VVLHMVFLRIVGLSLVTASVVPTSPILFTRMTGTIGSSETWVQTRATRRNIPEDTILHSHLCENFKSYIQCHVAFIVLVEVRSGVTVVSKSFYRSCLTSVTAVQFAKAKGQ
jgi:hypothetical protein